MCIRQLFTFMLEKKIVPILKFYIICELEKNQGSNFTWPQNTISIRSLILMEKIHLSPSTSSYFSVIN